MKTRVIKITDTCDIYFDTPGFLSKKHPKWHRSIYDRWYRMWIRCKNPQHKQYNNYKNCEIDEKYRYFSYYLNDIMQLENFDKLCEEPSKWNIDKDKIDPNNRCYFFEHLSIISKTENSKECIARNGSPMENPEVAKKKWKPIKAINIKDGSIITFKSLTEAEESGFRASGISKCLSGKYKTHKGYKWEYLE